MLNKHKQLHNHCDGLLIKCEIFVKNEIDVCIHLKKYLSQVAI